MQHNSKSNQTFITHRRKIYYYQISSDHFKRKPFQIVRIISLTMPPFFLQLLEEHIDLNLFIPSDFFRAYYQAPGRKRINSLTVFLSALVLQKTFSIPSDSLPILFLSLCKELREFYGFEKVPDAPLFTRFMV